MVITDPHVLTAAHKETLQTAYLWGRIQDRPAQVSDVTLEPDGRRRSKVIKEAVAAGFIREIGKHDWHGNAFEVTEQILRTLQLQEPNLLDRWTELYEKYSHRDAYSRPWIRLQEFSISEQFSLIDLESVDWFVVSSVPYEYHAFFAEKPETIMTEPHRPPIYDCYFSGPIRTIEEAVSMKAGKSTLVLAVSSPGLRVTVLERFAEQRIQRAFASNLIWGLVELGIVPKDLVLRPDGTPGIDSQLIEGQSQQFLDDTGSPCSRAEVQWETNLAESIDRTKSRIEKLQATLTQLRTIDRNISNYGGWEKFKDELEHRLRQSNERH